MVLKFSGGEEVIQGLNDQCLELGKSLRVLFFRKLVNDADLVVNLSGNVVRLHNLSNRIQALYSYSFVANIHSIRYLNSNIVSKIICNCITNIKLNIHNKLYLPTGICIYSLIFGIWNVYTNIAQKIICIRIFVFWKYSDYKY